MQHIYHKICSIGITLFERSILPDCISRLSIRRLLSYRLQEILAGDACDVANREQKQDPNIRYPSFIPSLS
jgi:hypothetical protein